MLTFKEALEIMNKINCECNDFTNKCKSCGLNAEMGGCIISDNPHLRLPFETLEMELEKWKNDNLVSRFKIMRRTFSDFITYICPLDLGINYLCPKGTRVCHECTEEYWSKKVVDDENWWRVQK